MTRKEFQTLVSRLRGIYFRHHLRSLQQGEAQRATILKRLALKLKLLERLEAEFVAGTSGPELDKVVVICNDCDPEDLVGFPDKSAILVQQFTLIVPTVSERNLSTVESSESRDLDPIVDEAIGLLQTQSALIENRYEDLVDDGADIDEDEYRPLAEETSLAAGTYRSRLSQGEDSITFDELQEYKERRRNVLSASEDLFISDLERLKEYLLELLKISA
ncbi:hypothetical protein [Lewinella sp. W8]|uniref:hypothetical protein n=1 Tax=Lewinella sp. W8 TaxID=2528208 RepID=UPI0010678F0C|nr:hypothetical protein [Lewinella sp. W8]MTB51153.1 hypothetical protein [Lewinella sp. W8]